MFQSPTFQFLTNDFAFALLSKSREAMFSSLIYSVRLDLHLVAIQLLEIKGEIGVAWNEKNMFHRQIVQRLTKFLAIVPTRLP